jgi:hypothetical protein
MKRTFVLGIVAGLAVAGLTLGGCSDSPVEPDTITGTDTGVDTTGVDTTGTDTGTDTTGTDTATDVSTDTPPVGDGQKNYRITRLAIDTPGADQNTGFADLMNTVLPIAFQGGVLSDEPLYILATFSDVTPGASGVVVTFCQGANNAGVLSCNADPAPVSTTGTIDNSGNITTDAADFTFSVATPAGDIDLTLYNFTMSGLLDSTADNGPVNAPDSSTGSLVDGEFSAQLAADDLCGITLSNALLGSFCDGITTVNLLDLLDGPVAGCGNGGADGGGNASLVDSDPADLTACTAGTGADHNAPTDVGGGDFRFDTAGAFDLTGIEFAP